MGPEICDATVRVLEATGVQFDWDVHQAGEAAIKDFGTPLPEPARLVIVGDGEPGYVRTLQQLAEKHASTLPPVEWRGAIWGEARWNRLSERPAPRRCLYRLFSSCSG